MLRRHEVADDSFGFILPAAEASPEIAPPGPAIRTEPNTSAKRRRLSPEEPEAPTPAPAPAPPTSVEKSSSGSRSSARLSASRAQPSPAPPAPPEPQPQSPSASSQVRSSGSRTSARLNATRPNPYSLSEGAPSVTEVLEAPEVQPARAEAEVEDDDDELESLPAAVPTPRSHSSIVSRLSAGPGIIEEEVTESPVEAPGSGHRRRIRLSNAATQSARLQRAVMEEENGLTGEFTTSSPLARKTTRMSGTTTTTTGLPSALSTRASARMAAVASSSSPAAGGVSSSPSLRRPPRKSNSTVASGGSVRSVRSQDRRSTLSTVLGEDDIDELSSPLAAGTSSARKPQSKAQKTNKKNKKFPLEQQRRPEPIEEEEEEQQVLEVDDDDNEQAEAEEIDVHEAARRIGRKRPRASPAREESPELNAEPVDKAEPARKRRQQQKRLQESPAKQAQPKKVQPKVQRRKPQSRKSTSTSTERRGRDGDGDGGGGGRGEAIPIIVQRYTKPVNANQDEDSDADILGAAEIPFANRGGVNVIDVLAQMCDEVVESNLETLHKATMQAADSATRKEYRTKLRALEAFQEELRTRLLEHVSFFSIYLFYFIFSYALGGGVVLTTVLRRADCMRCIFLIHMTGYRLSR